MIASAAPIIKIVVRPKMYDIFPFVLSCDISLSLSIVMRAIRMGTATTLFITAAYTSDGIDTDKVDSNPAKVAIAITR
jgi:hypothetical protein